MIFAESLPLAKSFFGVLKLPASTVGLLTRLVTACIAGLHSASAAASAVRIDPRHRAQIVRFLARQGWSANWATLEALADLLLQSCLHEVGTWALIFDQTYHATQGLKAQNSFSRANKKRRAKNSKRAQKKTPPHSCHCFVFGLLISPVTGTRIPLVRPYYTEGYCRQMAAQASKARPAPVYRTQTDIAAEMIGWVRVPAGCRVLVLGDTAFEAEQIRASCARRRFDWIAPANPERVLAGKKPRRPLRDVCKGLKAETMTRIELCPGLTGWWRHQRGSLNKAWRGKYGRLYWAHAETLDVHNVGQVRVVFSTTKQPQTGQAVAVQKTLLTSLLDWDARQVVAAYSVRWQIEIFFKEMKSGLGLSSYRVRDFREVEGWVQACCLAFVYLEWYRLQQRQDSDRKEWWWRLRGSGLALQVLQDIEQADLRRIAAEVATEDGRAWLLRQLARAVPLEQRR
jgi:hypothetical protein